MMESCGLQDSLEWLEQVDLFGSRASSPSDLKHDTFGVITSDSPDTSQDETSGKLCSSWLNTEVFDLINFDESFLNYDISSTDEISLSQVDDNFESSKIGQNVDTDKNKDTIKVQGDAKEEIFLNLNDDSLTDIEFLDSSLTPTHASSVLEILSEGGDVSSQFESLVTASLTDFSPDEIESVLSSEPPSPDSSFKINDITNECSYVQPQCSPFETSDDCDPEYFPLYRQNAKKLKSKPYTKLSCKSSHRDSSVDKKLRKKLQNREAALRYREKKKQEAGLIFTECDQLKVRNQELNSQVTQISQEINYLKNLMKEVYKAKGIEIEIQTTIMD